MGHFNGKWLDKTEADNILARCGELVFKPYVFARTGKPLLRSPKIEFVSTENVGPYRWGQSMAEYNNAVLMPTWLREIAERLPGMMNHAVVIQYLDGKVHFQPHHRDKQDCQRGNPTPFRSIVGGTDIHVVSVGVPRRFEVKKFLTHEQTCFVILLTCSHICMSKVVIEFYSYNLHVCP